MEVFLFIFHLFGFIQFITCPYPPQGDEIQAGSVLLPASRRGRYLANIVRRQAVDGTGIKFNKDADRLNAEAKKKVDVLSDELLPYIIAEQERRTTLYKRIMTAIQNGEKGVTIAEIRNKPPLIIRKGIMYRCPSNRAPKEPDGTGIIVCEDDIDPTQIMYDSCLSAEDKDLYLAEGKYFFCNRHRLEGPDLPHNGSTIIGCAPIERTSLNYTAQKCTLEDTDDVVVHYRYYPDRTYKYVIELDPDHEVCDHWNPCQIGYIYSLPSPDQAILANELWRNYVEKWGEYEQIIPPIPEDSMEEFVFPTAVNYSSSMRHIKIPEGYTFQKLWARRNVDNYGWSPEVNRFRVKSKVVVEDGMVSVVIQFPEQWSDFFYSSYYAVFTKGGRRSNIKTIKFLVITPATAYVNCKKLRLTGGNLPNVTLIPYRCPRCHLQGIMIRTPDGHVRNLDAGKFRIIETVDRQGKTRTVIEVDMSDLKPQEYGDFFAIIQNADGVEERVKIISMQKKDVVIKVAASLKTVALGASYDQQVKYDCDGCELTSIVCNGEDAVKGGHVAVVPVSKMITFNFPHFDDSNACVYVGVFALNGQLFYKVISVIDRLTLTKKFYKSPKTGTQAQYLVPFTCSDCIVEKVTANGMLLQNEGSIARRTLGTNSQGAVCYYVANANSIEVRITEFLVSMEGIYQATFNIGGELITRTILEIGVSATKGGDGGVATTEATEEADTTTTEETTTL